VSARTDPGSFRDYESRVFIAEGAVHRALSANAAANWEALVSSGLNGELSDAGAIVATEELEPAEVQIPAGLLAEQPAAVLRHERIPFISYPYEWPFAMLRAAAIQQLDLHLAALDARLTLRDSTPYNMQWRGTSPVFIDVGSFEQLEEGSVWTGYRQFCMQYLFPLMLRAHKGVSHRTLLRGSIEGIAPGEMNALMSARDRLRRGVFKHVYLHSVLERRHAASGGEVKQELKRAGFGVEIVRANLTAMRKLIQRLDWTPGESAWTAYGRVNEYQPEDERLKREFIERLGERGRRRMVWDLGANDGRYSEIAAGFADYTLAIDGDEETVNATYCRLREAGDDRILPLVVDLADPSPGIGWRGEERRQLRDRGTPELVLALALVHHLSIAGGVPVTEVLEWLRSFDSELVIEFVDRHDPMVELLLSRKEAGGHPDYTRESFERALTERFEVGATLELCEGRRCLYRAHPRS
jgi:hypothetical protein